MVFFERVRARFFSPVKRSQAQKILQEQPSTTLLLVSVWFGLVFGLLEGAGQIIKLYYLDRIIRFGPDVVWMAPLATVILFLVIGTILFLAARQWPKLITLPTIVFIFTFLGFFSLLSLTSRVHIYAKVLLAAGLAVQTTGLIIAHPQRFFALVRYTTGWIQIFGVRGRSKLRPDDSNETNEDLLPNRRQFIFGVGATIAGLAAGVQGWEAIFERHTLSKLPGAPLGAPNVLLVVLDTVRAQSLSLYGYARSTTPYIEQFAKTGVCFKRAFSTSSWTLPSHASMFTGRFPHELSTGWLTPLDDTYPTLAELLSTHGYLTAGFVANTEYCSHEFGLDRGFVHYEDYSVSLGQITRSSSLTNSIALDLRQRVDNYELLGRKNAAQLNSDFLRWLSHQDSGQPFFAFLNYYDAHDPYLPPAEFALKFASKIPRGNLAPLEELSPLEVQELIDAYDGAIGYLDHELDLLFAELQRRSLLENTLVIITSDHGEEFGEHGLMGHATSLYLPSLYVPLLISFPVSVPKNRVVNAPVSLRDLSATIIDLTHLDSGEFTFPGQSLARYWTGATNMPRSGADMLLSELQQSWGLPSWYPSMKGPMKSLVFDRYHYIKNGDGREELYDFEQDPWESQDLSGSAEDRQLIERFRRSLDMTLAKKS